MILNFYHDKSGVCLTPGGILLPNKQETFSTNIKPKLIFQILTAKGELAIYYYRSLGIIFGS